MTGPHIWIPRVKILEPRAPIRLHHTIEGFFTLRALDRYGRVRRELRTPNLVTDNGLNLYTTTNNYRATIAVGTGTNAPNVTDTQLQTLVASTATTVQETQQTGGTYFIENSWLATFSLGAISANLTEIGIGPGATNLFARDLIRDSGGNPTTFPVASDEQLQAAHTIRRHIPSSDVMDSITIDGSGSHDITIRALNAQNVTVFWGSRHQPYNLGTAGFHAAHDTDSLAAITATAPNGTGANATSVQSDSYTPGAFARTGSITWGLTAANFASGVGVIATAMTNAHTAKVWQVLFSPRIPKFAGSVQRIMVINCAWTWGRV